MIVTVTECQSQPVPAAGSGAAWPVTGTFGRSLARALSLRLRVTGMARSRLVRPLAAVGLSSERPLRPLAAPGN
jgi:hypothetical protein